MKKVIVGLLACGAVACGDLEGGEITLDEATAESTLEQTPSEVPSASSTLHLRPRKQRSPDFKSADGATRGRLLARALISMAMEDWTRSSVPTFARALKTCHPMREPGRDLRLDDGWLEQFIRWVYDADGSQSLDEAEKELLRADLEARCDARASILLENFDSDGDGELSESEREAARDARRAHHRERFEARLAEAGCRWER